MDWGAWWAAVSGVAQSWTRLKRHSSSSSRSWAEREMRKCQSMSTKLHLCEINKLCRSNVQQRDYSNNTRLCSWNLSMVKVKDTYSCLTLYDSVDYTVYGILQARILEWVAYPFSSRSSQLRNWTGVSYIAGGFFTNWAIMVLCPHHPKDNHVTWWKY